MTLTWHDPMFRHDFTDECAPGGSGFCDGCDCNCHGPYTTPFTTNDQVRAWHEDHWRGTAPEYMPVPIQP